MSELVLRPLGPDDVHPGSFGVPVGEGPLWMLERKGGPCVYGPEALLRQIMSLPPLPRDPEPMRFHGIPIRHTDTLFNL